MSRVLENDAELERAIEAMKKFSDQIDDPLSEPDEIKDAAWRLNATAFLVQKYSRGRIVQSDPNRAAYYKMMGWEYQIFGGAK